MGRGFNLLELTIIIAILSILLLMAVPSFDGIMSRVKMKRLASELNSFLVQAKSEAVTRNKKLYVHFSFNTDNSISNGSWYIQLTDSASSTGNQLLYFSGAPFNKIEISHSYNPAYITFDQVRGRPNGGTIEFFSVTDTVNRLKAVMANPPGRIKVCATSGAAYGYPSCS
ncbi:GspH/FimT family pseudopilin [Vibrio sp. 404]|uniref:Type II secretion system protein H n=2 Tax=Vibrio marinisediminis TaxID=2758441 RepID=A0A7W2IUH6_9VIBR|nr:GspH/FimT family pseudopilin [Vibrio marinisediminis]